MVGELLDSTLREGELFARLPLASRLRVAELIAEAGLRRAELTVDYPPRTTREDVEPLVRRLNELGVEVIIHGRANGRDVEAMCSYDAAGVALYIAATPLHLEHKLHGISVEEARSRLLDAVGKASSRGFGYVRATLEDASRLYVEGQFGELDRLLSFTAELREAGATLVSIPDTSGLMTPRTAREFFRYALDRSHLPLSAHFHNDYGYASSNTIEAFLEGASEAHVCILGVGDRNGIADLYEVAAALQDLHGVDLGVRREALGRIYREFSRLTGIKIPWRHPLSAEARTVRAGVHQSMTLRKPEGYVPQKKLTYDFDSLSYSAGPYMSHRLILEVARVNGLEISEGEARRVTEEIALRHNRDNGRMSLTQLAGLLSERLGKTIPPESLRRFFSEERVYLLLKMKPQIHAPEIVRELMSWDDVDSVDEVYGDVDIIVVGRMRMGSDNIVERVRHRFGSGIEYINVLVTD